MKKLVIVLIVLLVVAGVGVGGFAMWKRAQGATQVTSQATAKVEQGSLQIVVESNGPVVSNQDVPIKCKASGTVIKLPFDVSDRVKKDDILLQLDTDDQDRAVAKANAVLEASVAQLEQAKQDLVVSRQALITSRMKAEATLLMTQARQKDAHSKLDRQKTLLEKNLASQEEYETAATTTAAADADVKTAEAQVADLKTQELALGLKEQIIKVQQANVDQNKVNLDIQKQQLGYATVRSPIDGNISTLISGKDAASNDIITRIGTIVQSGTSSVSGGTTVMTVSDHSRMFVYANIPESDIGKIDDPQLNPGKPGQKVEITADAYSDPKEVFEGRVVRVADQGTVNTNVVNFEVRIEVDSPNKQLLKPKMTANVEIIIAEKNDVLLIPMAAFARKRPPAGANTTATAPAIATADTAPAATETAPVVAASRPRPRGPRSAGSPRPTRGTVNVLKADGTTEAREVTVGLADANSYEVLSGLQLGETVLLNKSGADSKWRGSNMGMMGGGGGRGR